MASKIYNESTLNLEEVEELLHSLIEFAKDRMGFSEYPSIRFVEDEENARKVLGKTANYSPATGAINIYASGRHPKDMLRSVSHELVHHKQNEDGYFSNAGFTGSGYAQKNSQLRELEREAYEKGNMCFRDWEDGIKQKNPTIYNEWRKKTMSLQDWKNKELQKLLMEKWGFGSTNEEKEQESDDEIAARTPPRDKKNKADFLPKDVRDKINSKDKKEEMDEGSCGDMPPAPMMMPMGLKIIDDEMEGDAVEDLVGQIQSALDQLVSMLDDEADDEAQVSYVHEEKHEEKEEKNEGKMKDDLHKQTLAMMKKHPDLSYEEAEKKVYDKADEDEGRPKSELKEGLKIARRVVRATRRRGK